MSSRNIHVVSWCYTAAIAATTAISSVCVLYEIPILRIETACRHAVKEAPAPTLESVEEVLRPWNPTREVWPLEKQEAGTTNYLFNFHPYYVYFHVLIRDQDRHVIDHSLVYLADDRGELPTTSVTRQVLELYAILWGLFALGIGSCGLAVWIERKNTLAGLLFLGVPALFLLMSAGLAIIEMMRVSLLYE